MSHLQQRNFVNKVKHKFPHFFKNIKALGIGTFNVNGTEDIYFTDCDYKGLDIGEGNGVDIICPAQDYNAPNNTFDIIISCECFEHNPYYKQTIINAIRMLKSGGIFVFTCAAPGRPIHGTAFQDKIDSLKHEKWITMPNVSRVGWDNEYYKNLDENDIRGCIDIDIIFSSYEFEVDSTHHDLYFWGLKNNL